MKTRSILLVLVLAAQCAFAEDHPPKSDASRPVAGGGTPVPFSTATVVSITPRQEVVLKLSNGKSRTFKFAIPALCLNEDGALVQPDAVSKGSRVLAHFMTEDGQVHVDRLIMQR
ncbi:MAG TPA: hypothetical protein VGW57_00210 [Chthoniobacterales bacterium]|nr:hypothetical protein [Chthoniobacterales bacterium]